MISGTLSHAEALTHALLSALTRTSSHTDHCSVKPSLRRNHPLRKHAPRSRSRRDRNCADRRRSRSRSRRSASIANSLAISLAIEISEIAIAISPISREASIAASRDRDLACDRDRDLARDRDRRDCDRDLADRDRADRDRDRSDRDRDLTENTICPSGFSHREIDLFFWVLFEFLGMNDIMCLFGS